MMMRFWLPVTRKIWPCQANELGYVAVSPRMEDSGSLIDAMIFANRILGFINAPAPMQRLGANFQNTSVDMGVSGKARYTV
jgi:aspartate aminotransferase